VETPSRRACLGRVRLPPRIVRGWVGESDVRS